MRDLALMKQDGGGGSSFPQGEVNASAFLPTGHSVAGDQKGRVGLFSPQLKGESPRILKVFTNTRWIDVLNEDEDDWRNATRRVKIFVPITALLPWVDVGGTESEMVRDLGPIAKKCNVFRSNVAPHPKTKAYGAEDEDEEPEPQLTPIDYIDQFFNDANGQELLHHVQKSMEHQLEVDLPKTDDGPSANKKSAAAVAEASPPSSPSRMATGREGGPTSLRRSMTGTGSPTSLRRSLTQDRKSITTPDDGQKRPSSSYLVIGDDHGRVRVIKLALGKSALRPVPQKSKMHPYAGEVDIAGALVKKSEKDKQEKRHLYYEEVKEVEPKIVVEWEAHPQSAITRMEPVVGVNALLTCGEDAYVRMWNCQIGSKHAGDLLCSIDTKRRSAIGSWSMPILLGEPYLLIVQGYRVLERIYGEKDWEMRVRKVEATRRQAALAAEEAGRERTGRRDSKRGSSFVQQQHNLPPMNDIDDPWKKVKMQGRYFKMMDLEEISALDRMAKEENDRDLKTAQMITPNKWQPKNVEIELTQKPLDPYAALERKQTDIPIPDDILRIRGGLSCIDKKQREGESLERLPRSFRMERKGPFGHIPTPERPDEYLTWKGPDGKEAPFLPLALNAVEDAALQERMDRRQRRKFSAKREGESRISLGVQQMDDVAPVSSHRSQQQSTPSRVSDDMKPVKCTAMYQTFELSQSMQDFHRSYKRQLNFEGKRLGGGDDSKVFESTAQSFMSQSMTNFSSTRSADRFSRTDTSSQPDRNVRDKANRSFATRSGPTLGTPSTRSRDSNPTDHKSFNAVSGRDHALSGRDVRFRVGEGQNVFYRSARYEKGPT
jgi:hypothetical protein